MQVMQQLKPHMMEYAAESIFRCTSCPTRDTFLDIAFCMEHVAQQQCVTTAVIDVSTVPVHSRCGQ